ncbi:PLP-dependent aminotransferase family protein [Fundidesulfovibrio agrisoli]|uniref:MocR-like pyridoxine biosynthesis transcription factor PdxR n=1 Tax=Fundidesulfovibrio agrisoli TaxID=2922717 RepID=UPI001FABA7A0|nr:PLP-dependent aminotransferase family protein [Fundidesulfovibrio agrisoli]
MLILNHDDPRPLYVQIYAQVRERVLTGKLPAEARLPSARDMAAELGVSRNTVESAYQELLAEGYIHTKARSGYFVSTIGHEVPPAPPQRTAMPSRVPRTRYTFDFHPAGLDPVSFPASVWRKYYLEHLRMDEPLLARYGDPQGDPALRASLRDYLERSRGVACGIEHIVICSGLQHSLDMVAQLLRGRCMALATEDPGYPLPREVFANHGYEVVPTPVGPGGLDLAALEASTCDIAYITPSHQFPLGEVMPIANRLRLIEWARQGRFIIEDDYDSELRYQGKPIPSLQGLRPDGNIIYTGTFSKILSPALRLSYMVLPPSLLAEYHRRFLFHLPGAALPEQRTLAAFMDNGHLERHLRRMRAVYRKKRQALTAALARHFGPKAEVIGQEAGLHVVVRLMGEPRGEAERTKLAEASGIRLLPFSIAHADGRPADEFLLLGFGAMTPEQLDQGVRLLFDISYGPEPRSH